MDAPESLAEVINDALKDVKPHSIERYYTPLLSSKQRLQDPKKSEEAAVVALTVGLTTGLGDPSPKICLGSSVADCRGWPDSLVCARR